MATNTEVGVKITVDGSDAVQSVGSIKKQLREATADLIAMRQKFGDTSAEAVAAAKRVANLKDEIGDAKALTDAFNPDAKFKAFGSALQGVAGGFAAVQGAQALFGAESEELEKTLVKVQGALALSQGLNSVLESVDAFKNLGAVLKGIPIIQRAITAAQFLWNAAVSANPIGALVTVIVALIAAGAALIKFFINSSNEAKRNEAAVKANTKAVEQQTKANERNSDQLQRNQKYTLELAKANGATTKEIRALELKLIDEKIAMIASARATALATAEKNRNYLATLKQNDASDELIKKQQEVTNKSIEEANKQTKNLDNANIEKLELIRRQNVEVIKEQKKSDEDAAKKAQENRQKRKEKEDEDRKKQLEKEKEFRQKLAEQQQISDDFAIQQRLQSFKNEFDRKQFELSVQNQKEIDKQLEYLNQKLISEQEYNNRKTIIDADFATKQAENEAARRKAIEDQATAEREKSLKVLDDRLKDEQLSFEYRQELLQMSLENGTISQIQYNERYKEFAQARMKVDEAEAQAKIDNAKTIGGMVSQLGDILGRETAAGKAAAVAAASIDTYAAAWTAFKQAQKNPISIIGPAYPYIQAGLAVAAGLANIRKIVAVKTPGPSSGASVSAPSGGGLTPPPTLPPLTPQAETTLLNQGQVNQIGNVAARAYVVESDVSGNQQRIQRLERAARIA
jgi:hypothetical protein